MKRIVNFSGGLCSFWSLYRVIERYGKDDVTILFADTLIEDPDLYRFNSEVEAYFGIKITRLSIGLSPWELFRKQGMIGNNRMPICSVILKREPLDEWHRINCIELDSIIYVGMDWTEAHRLEAMRKAKPFWNVEAPMTEAPFWDKQKMIDEARALGFTIPRLYGMGFAHNNCGGGCVSAGITQFVHLYHVLPDVFENWESEEQATIAELESRDIEWMSFLKDRRGGVTRNLTLRQLRWRIENEPESLPKYEWGGCGCSTSFVAPNTLPGEDG